MDLASLLNSLLAMVHALAGAAWFGAMFYSLLVLQPRARRYFDRPAEFEVFIATLSQGARWTMLAAFGIIGVTGVGLVLSHSLESASRSWLLLVGLKALIFFAAFGLFVYVSWRLWPARVLALDDEIPRFQKVSRRLAATMLVLVGLSIALGILAHG